MVSLMTVIAILSLMIHMIDKIIKIKASDEIFLNRFLKNRTNVLIVLYHFFQYLPITKHYINHISRRYEIIYPGNKKETSQKAISLALIIWFISGAIFISVFHRKPTLYTVAITALLVSVVNAETIHMVIRKSEIKLLMQIDKFLSNVRHFYYVTGAVDDAIIDAIELADKEMKIHAAKIYDTLVSDNLEEEISKYNGAIQNNFLKMFLSQCVSVLNYGDKEVEGESLFLRNIKNLKVDITIEIVKIKKINFLFSGLIAITIGPVLVLDLIKNWAISNLSGLESFYNGMAGKVLSVAIFVLTIVIYNMVNHLRETKSFITKDYRQLENFVKAKFIKTALDNYENKYYGKMESQRDLLKKMGEIITPRQLLIKRVLYAALTFVFGLLFVFNIHAMSKNNIVNKIENVEQLTTAASAGQIIIMEEVIIQYVDNYKEDEKITLENITSDITNNNLFSNKLITNCVSNEIMVRIQQFRNEYFKWYELLVILTAAYIAYCYPYWMILFRKKILKMNMEDEVIQFQSIILMLMYIDRMTVLNILEFMENFAVIFKRSIQDCINDYANGDVEALEKLKGKEIFEPFRRLVDNLIICDKIGLEKAFDEIAVDRMNYTEKRKHENEINLTNKLSIAKLISYIPLILVVGFYLILPFIIESLNQLNMYRDELTLF